MSKVTNLNMMQMEQAIPFPDDLMEFAKYWMLEGIKLAYQELDKETEIIPESFHTDWHDMYNEKFGETEDRKIFKISVEEMSTWDVYLHTKISASEGGDGFEAVKDCTALYPDGHPHGYATKRIALNRAKKWAEEFLPPGTWEIEE